MLQCRSPVEATDLERHGPIRGLQRNASTLDPRPQEPDLSLGLACSAVFTVRL